MRAAANPCLARSSFPQALARLAPFSSALQLFPFAEDGGGGGERTCEGEGRAPPPKLAMLRGVGVEIAPLWDNNGMRSRRDAQAPVPSLLPWLAGWLDKDGSGFPPGRLAASSIIYLQGEGSNTKRVGGGGGGVWGRGCSAAPV